MKATELRLGNLTQDQDGNLLKVYSLDENNIKYSVLDRSKFPLMEGWQAEPIPLTAGVLKKTPFVIDKTKGQGKLYNLGRLTLVVAPDNPAVIYFDGYVFCYINSDLHSLQNFYFAVMREELTVKY